MMNTYIRNCYTTNQNGQIVEIYLSLYEIHSKTGRKEVSCKTKT